MKTLLHERNFPMQQGFYFLTKSGNSPVSLAKSNKQWRNLPGECQNISISEADFRKRKSYLLTLIFQIYYVLDLSVPALWKTDNRSESGRADQNGDCFSERVRYPVHG